MAPGFPLPLSSSCFGERFPLFQRLVLFQTPLMLWVFQLRGAWTRVSHKTLLVVEGKTAPSWSSHRIAFCSLSGGLSYFHDGICLPSLSTVHCVLKSASSISIPAAGKLPAVRSCLWSLLEPDRRGLWQCPPSQQPAPAGKQSAGHSLWNPRGSRGI